MHLHLKIEFGVNFLVLLNLFFFRNLFIGRSCEPCNEAWHYVIQLVVWMYNDFLKLKHLREKCRYQLGSELHVRTHINGHPCFLQNYLS